MKSQYETTLDSLRTEPKKWLVTGVGGFIGSNLLETLLLNGQEVVGLDNFATGYQRNLDEVQILVGEKWSSFKLIEGDIRNLATCHMACKNIDYVLHQAALGSVPRSINDPIMTNSTNIDGYLNMLVAARDAEVKSFTYAASSSTYGDHPGLPKVEDVIGKPLSPYAVTKYVNELYADVFDKTYGFKTIGLRYFNVFGKRQDPSGGGYAAVIPKWIAAMIRDQTVAINGDGWTSRDFCYIQNAVEANILSATASEAAKGQVYNVAVGDQTNLNDLFKKLKAVLEANGIAYTREPEYSNFRAGDVRYSQASIEKAQVLLGYSPKYKIDSGIKESISWYLTLLNKMDSRA